VVCSRPTCVDVRVRDAGVPHLLTGVLQAPEVTEVGIVRGGRDADPVVGLGVQHIRATLELPHGRAAVGADVHQLEPGSGQPVQQPAVDSARMSARSAALVPERYRTSSSVGVGAGSGAGAAGAANADGPSMRRSAGPVAVPAPAPTADVAATGTMRLATVAASSDRTLPPITPPYMEAHASTTQGNDATTATPANRTELCLHRDVLDLALDLAPRRQLHQQHRG
jgi:hypothetical protein